MRRIIVVLGALAIVAIVAAALLQRPPDPLPVKKLDPWVLQSNDPDDPYGTYLGNGCIAARINSDGIGRNGPCLMSGLYEGEGLMALPIWSDLLLYDRKRRRFALAKSAPYRQTLTMREGYVETELTLLAGRQRLTGKVTVFVVRPEARERAIGCPDAVIRYELTPRRNGEVHTNHELQRDAVWRTVRYPDGGTAYIARRTSGEAAAVALTTTDAAGRVIDRAIPARRGERFVLTRYVCVVGPSETLTKGPGQIERDLRDRLTAARRLGYERVFAEHRRAWRDLWRSDIVIQGDPEAQQLVHAMMFYLLSSASPGWSIPPTGLSSGAWQGHIFWDADTWMLPALLLQHPKLAEGIVRYRLRTLPGARQNAGKRGLAGAEFAWESARTGLETVGMPFCEERHVTADAAMAAFMWSQAAASTVESEPRQIASQLLRETAECWVSRVKYNSVEDQYQILNVVPPDEDAEIVNNSVYTNAAARRNLELAVEATSRTPGSAQVRKWAEIARKMYIPFDAANGRFIAYDGYDGGKTKQADTELLIYPLSYPMPDDVKRNTFDFYKTKTDPRGPAMTSSIHAVIAAELGRRDEAYEHFKASYSDFLRGPFLMFNEKRSRTYENMCFLTGCAGTLQSVIYGFGGLRVGVKPEGFEEVLPDLYIKPCLPPKWKKLVIRNINWHGKTYDLVVAPGDMWEMRECRMTNGE